MALFSNRRPRAESKSSAEQETAQLDVMARLLRTWGENAFDTDEFSAEAFGRRCDDWARHLLTSTPAPSSSAWEDAAEGEPGSPTARRRYPDLLQDMQRHRQKERSFVTKTMSGLKGAMWDIVTQLREGAAAHARDDRQLQVQLTHLEAALDTHDITAIRRAATETVRAVSENIVARQERHTEQLAALGTRMKDLESNLVQVRALNRVDPLTGLQNRGALDEALPRMVAMSSISKEPISLLMVDIDHFKKINDTYGHPVGDAVLRAIGDALVRSFPRKSDFIARYGGEEFCVVLPGSGLDDSRRLAERFLGELRISEIWVESLKLRVTASVGVAEVGHSEKAETALARADKALYAAKRAGRDRSVPAEPG